MEKNAQLSDFVNAPGGLTPSNVWAFPTVTTADNRSGVIRRWNIYVAAFNGQTIVPIAAEWLPVGASTPTGIIGIYWTISGQEGGTQTTSEPTYVRAGKVKRNVIQQTMLEANTKWCKQGGKAVGAELMRPQLLKPISDKTIKEMQRKYPNALSNLFYQYKFNGVRCLSQLVDGSAIIYSRALNQYDVAHISSAVTSLLSDLPQLILDGELYVHGAALEKMSGLVRSGASTKMTAEEQQIRGSIVYMVFDVIVVGQPLPFSQRLQILNSLPLKPPLYRVETAKMPTMTQDELLVVADRLMRHCVTVGMEGAVLRAGDAGYDPAVNDLHSANVLKVKPTLSEEFPIVGYSDGNGKNAGMVQWRCRAPNGRDFNVVQKIDYEERKRIFAALSNDPDLFKSQYEGKPLTVEFAEWSTGGLPTQPRGIAIRDYE